MVLLLDIGNTRVKWARLSAGGLGRMDARVHADEQLKPALQAAFEGPQPKRVVVCNVAGPLVARYLSEFCQERLGSNPEFFISSAERCGVTNGYLDPVRLGADRWAAVIGGFRKFGGPVCVIDAGTAITVDAVNGGGRHLGGLIAPGPQTMRRSLADATAGLQDLGEGELALLAKDTRSAIWSGGWHTAAGLLERVHGLVSKQLGGSTKFVLTGGDARRLDALLPGRFTLCPELVLMGLAAAASERP
ncbi:MAG TPA: type III pantothenate kinase [Gammaproteobacteria bacterium]|jgi:type III pantothenate kinase|nr:type III pantothenate kinase [Gammaproteobacteria bacterium]